MICLEVNKSVSQIVVKRYDQLYQTIVFLCNLDGSQWDILRNLILTDENFCTFYVICCFLHIWFTQAVVSSRNYDDGVGSWMIWINTWLIIDSLILIILPRDHFLRCVAEGRGIFLLNIFLLKGKHENGQNELLNANMNNIGALFGELYRHTEQKWFKINTYSVYTPSCSGPIPAEKIRGNSVLSIFSNTMPKMDFYHYHCLSWEKTVLKWYVCISIVFVRKNSLKS